MTDVQDYYNTAVTVAKQAGQVSHVIFKQYCCCVIDSSEGTTRWRRS